MGKDRTKSLEERQAEVRPIIEKLTEMHLSVVDPPIKELFRCMQTFITTGEKIEINIPYEKIGKVIEGLLNPKQGKRTWVRLSRGRAPETP